MRYRAILGVAFLAIAVLAVAGGLLGYQQWRQHGEREEALAQLQVLPFPDLQGKTRSLADWRGQVVVVNFWATWCEPCREEVPALQRVRSRYADSGVEVVGIAFDHAAKVQQFAAEFRLAYPLLIGALGSIDLTRKLGNRMGALPYTLVLSRQGRIVFTHLGVVSEAQLRAAVEPLLGATASR
jgi:peroxiredoxin